MCPATGCGHALQEALKLRQIMARPQFRSDSTQTENEPSSPNPAPGADFTMQEPPNSAARSWIEVKPTPARYGTDIPTPSSEMSISIEPLTLRVTWPELAAAWRITLVRAP